MPDNFNGNLAMARSPISRQRTPRMSIPRKKACQGCTAAKARCNLARPRCSRCEARQTPCVYAVPEPPVDPAPRTFNRPFGVANLINDDAPAEIEGQEIQGQSLATPNHSSIQETVSPPFQPGQFQNVGYPPTPSLTASLDTNLNHRDGQNEFWTGDPVSFERIELICTLDPTMIRNRWLADFIPSVTDRTKTYSPGVSSFISRVIKTYPHMLLNKGQLPPFIHPSQMAGPEFPTPLANCLSLVRLWDGQVRGSEAIVSETIKKEMDRLYSERATYNAIDLLSAFQAYLLYAIMGFISPLPGQLCTDRSIMINLLDFACDIAASGLVCPGEISQTRPDWESWIVADAKRRTLYILYLFDNIFCAANGLPTFLAVELEGLPAPARKSLWEAVHRNQWEETYTKHLIEWPDTFFRIDDLWPDPPHGDHEKTRRVDRWVRSVDELGMMVFAITHITHGS